MPIRSADTTDIVVVCPIDLIETSFTVASLEVGSRGGKDQIVYPTLSCGHVNLTHWRTYDNPSEQAGIVNGLHEHLIDLAQISSEQPSLATEPPEDKPLASIVYPITASPLVPAESTTRPLVFGWDLSAALVLRSIADNRAAITQDRLLTGESNGAIGAFVTALYASQADRDLAAERLKERRDAEIP